MPSDALTPRPRCHEGMHTMRDTLKKVKAGNPPTILAARSNAFADAAGAIVKKAVAGYVEKVYEEGNFAGWGLGHKPCRRGSRQESRFAKRISGCWSPTIAQSAS